MSSTTLKYIAILSMFIDHIGAILFPEIIGFRIIGRLAFPIFAFLLTEGFIHTKNIKRYTLRLVFFAIISEIPFNMAFYNRLFYMGHLNIFFTLLLGLVSLILFEKYKDKKNLVGSLCVYMVMIIGLLLNVDYSIYGVLMIFVFYYFRYEYKKIVIYIGAINTIIALSSFSINMNLQSLIQLFAIVSLAVIALYNGQKGKQIQYFFYIFYPLHLMILYGAALFFA
ncbi:TraX protein [Natranaerovirga hydrolytica]|uniref:TraX protein n=1 Tax=Natranaerovirga hydrolytica TaxID=680378 RepID=A0A4R1MX40_9FIRM|nr:TraX family protein [Natranaerovirga hydrolytica]TCK97766.1 TraX protein [Natranaerovirga hydrolytica]